MNPKTERFNELACAHICDWLVAHGYHRGTDPIWLARLLFARITAAALLARLQRR